MLRARSRQPQVCVELSGANHAFDLYYSLRYAAVHDGSEVFTAWVRSNAAGSETLPSPQVLPSPQRI